MNKLKQRIVTQAVTAAVLEADIAKHMQMEFPYATISYVKHDCCFFSIDGTEYSSFRWNFTPEKQSCSTIDISTMSDEEIIARQI